jgi:DNA-binding MarR family transcriptional regulator
MAKANSTIVKPPAVTDLGVVDGLVQLSFSVQSIVGNVTARYDASIIQSRLLGALRDRALSMAQISRLLNLDKSSTTGLVDRAESKGYVARTTVPEDGRAIHVTLTTDELASALTESDRDRLSLLASKFVHLDAAARGIDLTTGRISSASRTSREE